MIVAVLVGCLVGAGLLLVLLRLAPPRVAPLVQLGRFDQAQGGPAPVAAGATFSTGADGLFRRQESLGRWLSRQLLRRNVRYTSLRQDLALTGRSFEQTHPQGLPFGSLRSALDRPDNPVMASLRRTTGTTSSLTIMGAAPKARRTAKRFAYVHR